jgi:hypothetical protein
MQDRKHHPEQRGGRGLCPEHQREQPGGEGEIRHQEPDRQEQKVQPVRLDMVIVMQAVLQLAKLAEMLVSDLRLTIVADVPNCCAL